MGSVEIHAAYILCPDMCQKKKFLGNRIDCISAYKEPLLYNLETHNSLYFTELTFTTPVVHEESG